MGRTEMQARALAHAFTSWDRRGRTYGSSPEVRRAKAEVVQV